MSKKILVVGATGYVGSRVIPRFLEKGYRVRAAGRSLPRLKEKIWAGHSNVELAELDVFKREDLRRACRECFGVCYFVHSMNNDHRDFAQADRQAATNMVWAAESAGIERMIYLSGLGDDQEKLSRHLQSRHEVGKILQSGGVPTTILRAAMILGTGSLSFEIMRYLVDRLPVMITPAWVKTRCQPIAIRNVLDYVLGCFDQLKDFQQSFDIGGPDVLDYRELMNIYAQEAGLSRRKIIATPFLTPHLSSYWIQLVTPVSASIARPLVEGLKNEVVCRNGAIRDLVPQTLLSCRQAIRAAIDPRQWGEFKERQKNPFHYPVEWKQPGDPSWVGGRDPRS